MKAILRHPFVQTHLKGFIDRYSEERRTLTKAMSVRAEELASKVHPVYACYDQSYYYCDEMQMSKTQESLKTHEQEIARASRHLSTITDSKEKRKVQAKIDTLKKQETNERQVNTMPCLCSCWLFYLHRFFVVDFNNPC